MAETTKNTVVIDYTSRDFDAIRSMLVGIAKGKLPEWLTVGQASDFGTLLLELYAYMGDVTNYYIDRVGSEAFLGTAQRRQSIYYIADMLGYKPLGQRAAVVSMTFTLSATATANVTVPSGTMVSTRSSNDGSAIYFETDYDITLIPGQSLTVTATEGTTVTEVLATSTGQANASYRLSNSGAVFQSIKMTTVEGGVYIPWIEVDAVSNARPNQSAFSTYLDDDNYTYIVLGDSSAGRVPPPGSDISVTYRYGVGSAAQSLGSGTITNLVSSQSWVPLMSVTNNEPPAAGADAESLESMRFSIPRASRVRSRAVTLDDHVTLSLQVPGVAKAIAYGSVYSAVTIRIAPVAGFSSSERADDTEPSDLRSLRTAVGQYVQDKVLVGARVFVERPEWHDVEIALDVNVLDGYEQETVSSAVSSAVSSLFAFENLDFGEKVTKGDVFRAVTKVAGVDFVEITKMRPVSPSAQENPRAAVQNIITPPRKIAQIRRSRETATFGEFVGLTVNVTGGLGQS